MQTEKLASSRGGREWFSRRALITLALTGAIAGTALPATAGTLDRIRDSGHLKLGYLVDLRPFSYRSETGEPEGYGIDLCRQVAAEVKKQVPSLAVDWVPVTADRRIGEVELGSIDLLCSPMSVTLARRKDVAFSIPVIAGGNRAVMRADSAAVLRDALAESRTLRPVWRGSPAAKVLKGATFGAVTGTTTIDWLEERRAAFQVDAKIVPVADYRTGLQQLRERKIDVLFGERTLVLGAMDDAARKDLVVLDRLFTHESGALALSRNDDDFRLLVDGALSRFYGSGEFRALYGKWFGAFDESSRAYFVGLAIPE
jgi:polar amino acid transport system substrate-binding protein